jgi:hypothetical protein
MSIKMSVVPELAKWAGLPEDGVRAYVSKDPSSAGLILARQALQQYAKAHDVRHEDAEAILQARLGELVQVATAKAAEIRKVAEADRKAIEEMLRAEAAEAEAAAAARRKAAAEEAQRIAILESRVRTASTVLSSLDSHRTMRTLCHNFHEAFAASDWSERALFVAYSENKGTGERTLRIINVQGELMSYAPNHIPVPASWATHYEHGKTPFMSTCPTCGKRPVMHTRYSMPNSGGIYNGGHVECAEHYKWEPANNQHFKWEKIPPRPHMPGQMYFGPPWPEGRWVLWDPSDPDGSRAAAAAKEAKAASIRKQIADLEAVLAAL